MFPLLVLRILKIAGSVSVIESVLSKVAKTLRFATLLRNIIRAEYIIYIIHVLNSHADVTASTDAKISKWLHISLSLSMIFFMFTFCLHFFPQHGTSFHKKPLRAVEKTILSLQKMYFT